MNALRFTVTHSDTATKARTGLLETPHGTVETPTFMPVGTLGTVKGLTQDQLEELGVQILLANTYHLYLRPGEETVRDVGGLHRLMSWKRAILTDSGGFQVFSLRALRKVTDEGVDFRSHLDGSRHLLSPERAVEIQAALGSDIMMVLDECTEYPSSHAAAQKAMERTLQWAARSRAVWERLCCEQREKGEAGTHVPVGALFGIVQGGVYPELRRECAGRLAEMDLPGYAMGGLSLGEARPLTLELVSAARECLPESKPRYVMGVGLPEELPQYVAQGVDMMDCVIPTRNGRNGLLFTSQGRVHIRQTRFARDTRPVDESCRCPACRRYSRAYLRHLFVSGEMLGGILNSCHNLFFYLDTMRRIRQTIAAGDFSRFLFDFSLRLQGEAP
jgi:queuine tRNA-ribosyltransferase